MTDIVALERIRQQRERAGASQRRRHAAHRLGVLSGLADPAATRLAELVDERLAEPYVRAERPEAA